MSILTVLTKGGNCALETPQPMVSVRWRVADSRIGDVDVSAFVLRTNGKVSGDGDMVFYGQPRSGDGKVVLDRQGQAIGGGALETRFTADLPGLPGDVEKIAFTATIQAAPGVTFAGLAELEITVNGGGGISFPVPVTGAEEVALILGELYRRNGVWKFRAVGQGFRGGLKPLAESFGVVIAADPPPSSSPPPAPKPVPSPSPVPQSQVNLSKVTLNKAKPTIDLAKKASGYGEVRINLNWNRQKSGGGFFSGFSKGIDLDLGCMIEMADGARGVVQALGNSYGFYDDPPFVQLSGDDRTGRNSDGEWLRINGSHWDKIRRLLIYAYIYEGVPNWAATDGVITLYPADSAPVEVRLEEGSNNLGMCAVALLENAGGQMRVSRQVRYFQGHADMDQAFGWGLRWVGASKD